MNSNGFAVKESTVRSGKILSILMMAFLVGGMLCSVSSLSAIWVSGHFDLGMLAPICFVGGGAAGLLAVTSFRRNCRILIQAIHRMTVQGKLFSLRTESHEIQPLITAVNDMVESAEKCMSDAILKMKELEIQLKVATSERQHAQAIIYSISDAVLVTDTFDELVLANEAAARTFQFDLEKNRRARVEQVIQDEKLVELIRDMRQSNSKSGRRIVEHKIKGPGEEKIFKVTLSAVADDTDAPAGVVAVLHDMTREKEVAEMKNDFVSSVSHELRTPLASIKAYVEMLIDGEADDEKTTHEFYEVIQNEANRLSRLIDNILNISRIESGLVQINKQPQSLMVILKEALEVIAPQAKMRQISLVEQLTPAFYQTSADKDMLYQAVLNLLSNAVKYTPERGTITVQTTVDEAKRRVITRISDTGVGIPPKDLPFVFDKFYRAEANNHMAKGTGLGLSLVKHIIETVHRGRIFVESHVGKGSCFGFELELCD
jgi:two-component system, OmpR family, phosphate regulon sensor histidine kinase PhoR